MSITVGLKGKATTTTSDANSAKTAGSGVLDVFATPSMVALMEQAAWTSIAPFLGEEESSVGTALNISHSSATPLGLEVWAESEVTEVDGKRIEFTLTAYDSKGEIGKGTHQRFIVNVPKFMSKTTGKLS
ncbi:MAG: thioesterase family protein [Eubacteriales bacterium]